jgi:glycosyltransferase involved in cell wall biosynthesis
VSSPKLPSKPVLFVTNHVPPDRVGAFAALHERVGIELALFGGRSTHATAGVDDPGVPHRHVEQREIAKLAAARRYRAVVCGTAGRVALPAAWAGARAGRTPFLLWSALWAHPRTPAHAAGTLLLAAIYRDAHAVVAYGPHVAAFARAYGARNVHIAPQAVDNAFWRAPAPSPNPVAGPADGADFRVAFLGRPGREKGVGVLLDAWRKPRVGASSAALVLVGVGSGPPRYPAGGAVGYVSPQPPEQIRNFLAITDVCVIPSLRTSSFREPWGLVANEAMNQSTPVIASDEVGAAAGGLVRHERNGLVVAAGDPDALTGALIRLREDAGLRTRLGDNARRDVSAYTYDAWAAGFARALAPLA